MRSTPAKQPPKIPASPVTAEAAVSPARLVGLPPVVSDHTVVLILGSFPGAASLRAGQYYDHPQNQFWKILQALWPQHLLPLAGPAGYAARCDWLLARGLGLWDVYASCERDGSLDTSIRNAQVNDFARLHGRCPKLAAIAHNGGESFRHAKAVLSSLYPPTLAHDAAALAPSASIGAVGAAGAMESIRLPSTSPANASWSFDRKFVAWRALMEQHGLL